MFAWDSSDRLFVVGNGETAGTRSNALTILKDGTMNINDAYNMPTADGTAGQFMTTDGSGGVTWQTAPADGDGDASNEIQVLSISGSDVSLSNGGGTVSIPSAPFGTTSNVTSNENGTYTSDDFVFGSPQLDDDTDANHDKRMFFDKSKGAVRAGGVASTEWDDANVGSYSVAFGTGTKASGWGDAAFGVSTVASGSDGAFAVGENTTASGSASFAAGGVNYSKRKFVNGTWRQYGSKWRFWCHSPWFFYNRQWRCISYPRLSCYGKWIRIYCHGMGNSFKIRSRNGSWKV